MLTFWSLVRAFSLARLPASCLLSFLRRLFFSIELVLAISRPLPSLLPEGEIEGAEQSPRLIVGLRRRAHHDIHAPDLLDLVVGDFREDDVFLDAHGVVATAVEGV